MAESSAEHPRWEIAHAYVWLCGFALLAALLESVYLDGRTAVVRTAAVAAAFAFNQVLTKTARLWTASRALWLLPTLAWSAGIALTATLVPGMGEVLVPGNPWAAGLVTAGVAGGVWPIARGK